MIRVLLIDDHKLIRVGIRNILETSPGISVVGEAETGEEGLRLARELKPDIVLLDINLPGMNGLECLRKLRTHDERVKIIVISMHITEPLPGKVLELGAAGYLTKSRAADEVLVAVQKISQGERYLSADVAQQLALDKLKGGSPLEHLSERELQVLLLVTQGKSITEIATQLSVSSKTVSTYRYRIFEKLNVGNDVELTRYAIRHGIIQEIA